MFKNKPHCFCSLCQIMPPCRNAFLLSSISIEKSDMSILEQRSCLPKKVKPGTTEDSSIYWRYSSVHSQYYGMLRVVNLSLLSATPRRPERSIICKITDPSFSFSSSRIVFLGISSSLDSPSNSCYQSSSQLSNVISSKLQASGLLIGMVGIMTSPLSICCQFTSLKKGCFLIWEMVKRCLPSTTTKPLIRLIASADRRSEGRQNLLSKIFFSCSSISYIQGKAGTPKIISYMSKPKRQRSTLAP